MMVKVSMVNSISGWLFSVYLERLKWCMGLVFFGWGGWCGGFGWCQYWLVLVIYCCYCLVFVEQMVVGGDYLVVWIYF